MAWAHEFSETAVRVPVTDAVESHENVLAELMMIPMGEPAAGRVMACIVRLAAAHESAVGVLLADNERLRGAFDDSDEKASVHWYVEWVEYKRRAEAAEGLLREVVDDLRGVGCEPCVGSMAPFEDLHGRIDAHLSGDGNGSR